MILALILSAIWSGLGLIYVGEVRKGILLAILAVVFQYITNYYFKIVWIVFFLIWILSLYLTYKEVKAFNGE
jgi:TM2 domain-containing membrane protein YozV